MKKNILVTGGAGYIGSFIVRSLKNSGHNVVIVDDFSSGHEDAVKGFNLYKVNLVTQKDKLSNLFKKYNFDGVIHMASYIQMGESFRDPGKYFENNINCANNLLDVMVGNKVDKIVFSSSAGVYGSPKKLPIKEDDSKNPENPYGETKLMIEKMLYWYEQAHNIKYIAIRYFNAAGASEDGSLGEDHPDESHIIPIFIKFALRGKKAMIFGSDYNTDDGTCVRDYIHVLDLAEVHVIAVNKLLKGIKSNYYNAGVGRGYSNREIVKEITKLIKGFKVKNGPRRPGDADSLYASVDKIKKDFDWQPKYDLKEIIKSAYKWHKQNPKGFKV